MQHIPHSTFDDEARFIVTISGLIEKGELPSLKSWERSVKDEKAKLVRKKQSTKEAEEAEALAKELGVWDEFYGSGKPSSKRGKAKGKGKGKAKGEEDGEEDTSALQALILKKRKNMDGFFDGLAAKYAEPEKGKGKKKRGKAEEADGDEEEEVQASPKKRARRDVPPPPEIDDAKFEKLQQKLFGDKPKPTSKGEATAASTKGKRGSKGKKSK